MNRTQILAGAAGLLLVVFWRLVLFPQQPLLPPQQAKASPQVRARVVKTQPNNHPRLVLTSPDGNARLDWSRDGRFVRADPMDKRQELERDTTYIEAKTGRITELDEKRAQRLFSIRPFYIGYDKNQVPLFVCRTSTGACGPLSNQPSDLHWVVLKSLGKAASVSPNSREILIANDGEVRSWSTRTGKFLKSVHFASSQYAEASFPPVLSPDARFVLAQTPNSDKRGVYNTRNGRLRFAVPSADDTDSDSGVSSSGREVWNSARALLSDNDQSCFVSFYDSQSGRLLWRLHTNYSIFPTFSPQHNIVAFAQKDCIELRDVRTGRIKRAVKGPASTIASMAFSPDDSQLWSSHFDGQIWSWRLR